MGGDYYDFLDPDSEDLTGVLADVSGKGVPAALLSSFLQGVLEVGFGSSLSLGEAVTGANNHLFQKTPSNRFVTLFLFRVKPSGEGEYVSAGHNPAYVCRVSTGGIEELNPCGMILGAFEDVAYESVAFRLNVGDILVVYSDGVTEAMDPNGEMFGESAPDGRRPGIGGVRRGRGPGGHPGSRPEPSWARPRPTTISRFWWWRGWTPEMPDDLLGSYEIIGPLGAGGMGEVYRARDTRLNRQVAIKILPPGYAEDSGRLSRFQREARVLASLNHSNIAAIYGFEEANDRKFFILELVDGRRDVGAAPGKRFLCP